MKFWAKSLKNIYRLAASPWLKKAKVKSIESVLQKSMGLLEPEMLFEIQAFILRKQTAEGGFADRAGKCDLYYSLFGYYAAEVLLITEVKEPLRKYVKKTVDEIALSGVHLYCGAILYAKLFGFDDTSKRLRKQVKTDVKQTKNQQSEYTNFLGILALYYLEDFAGILRILRSYKSFRFPETLPCPVMAAKTILLETAGKPDKSAANKLLAFYRGKGGFAALKQAPAEDLLSTAVALYALHFIDADIRLIKPECLSFIDGLYDNGGFLSMPVDVETDVEYTFYGLLGLGALS